MPHVADRALRRLCTASLAGAAMLLAAGCLPEDRQGTVQAHVVARTGAEYALRVEPVQNLESLRELRGRDIELRAASGIQTTLLAAEPGVRFDRGRPFSLEYGFDAAGRVVAADLHSLQALSVYRALDRAASLLRVHGHVPLRRLQVFYFPRFDSDVLGDLRSSLTDNAAFVWEEAAILVLPAFVLSELPLLLNEGVLAHELGHAVIHQEMFGAAKSPPFEERTEDEYRVLQRHLLAMHEAVSDLIAFAVTGEPDFIRPSLDADRDLAEPRDLTARDLEILESVPGPLEADRFDPHALGSVMARAVYELWPKVEGRVEEADRGRLLELTLASLRTLTYEPGKFTLASFPSALVAERMKRAADAEEVRASDCAVLTRRLAPLKEALSTCRSRP